MKPEEVFRHFILARSGDESSVATLRQYLTAKLSVELTREKGFYRLPPHIADQLTARILASELNWLRAVEPQSFGPTCLGSIHVFVLNVFFWRMLGPHAPLEAWVDEGGLREVFRELLVDRLQWVFSLDTESAQRHVQRVLAPERFRELNSRYGPFRACGFVPLRSQLSVPYHVYLVNAYLLYHLEQLNQGDSTSRSLLSSKRVFRLAARRCQKLFHLKSHTADADGLMHEMLDQFEVVCLSESAEDSLPTSGRRLIALVGGREGNEWSIRIFDEAGVQVVDASFTEACKPWPELQALEREFAAFPGLAEDAAAERLQLADRLVEAVSIRSDGPKVMADVVSPDPCSFKVPFYQALANHKLVRVLALARLNGRAALEELRGLTDQSIAKLLRKCSGVSGEELDAMVTGIWRDYTRVILRSESDGGFGSFDSNAFNTYVKNSIDWFRALDERDMEKASTDDNEDLLGYSEEEEGLEPEDKGPVRADEGVMNHERRSELLRLVDRKGSAHQKLAFILAKMMYGKVTPVGIFADVEHTDRKHGRTSFGKLNDGMKYLIASNLQPGSLVSYSMPNLEQQLQEKVPDAMGRDATTRRVLASVSSSLMESLWFRRIYGYDGYILKRFVGVDGWSSDAQVDARVLLVGNGGQWSLLVIGRGKEEFFGASLLETRRGLDGAVGRLERKIDTLSAQDEDLKAEFLRELEREKAFLGEVKKLERLLSQGHSASSLLNSAEVMCSVESIVACVGRSRNWSNTLTVVEKGVVGSLDSDLVENRLFRFSQGATAGLLAMDANGKLKFAVLDHQLATNENDSDRDAWAELRLVLDQEDQALNQDHLELMTRVLHSNGIAPPSQVMSHWCNAMLKNVRDGLDP